MRNQLKKKSNLNLKSVSYIRYPVINEYLLSWYPLKEMYLKINILDLLYFSSFKAAPDIKGGKVFYRIGGEN